MRVLADETMRSTQSQREESQAITEAVESVARRIQQIAASTSYQADQGTQILESLDVFRSVVEQNSRCAADLQEMVEALSRRARDLDTEIGRFTL